MRHQNTCKYSLFFTSIIFSTFLSCTSDDEESIVIDAGSDIQDDTRLEDTDISDADSDVEEEFTKPSTYTGGQMHEVFNCDSPCESSSASERSQGTGSRPHMMSTAYVLESWLYPDEYFVMDRYIMEYNRWWTPVDYHIMVLHEGERLPFRNFIVTGTEFPSLEEIESWDKEEFNYIDTVYRETNVPINFTIVIPPWAFPEKGAYNVQVLFYPKWEPIPEAPFLAMKLIKVGPITQEPHTSHTIYYGSESFNESSDDFRDRTDEAVKWESPNAGRFVGPINQMFLAPPTDIYDWEVFETGYDGFLADVFEVSEPTVTLKFYTSGVGWESPDSDTRGTNLYYLMRDGEVIDSFLLDPGDVGYDDLMNFEDEGVVLPIEVGLTEETTAFQLIAVPWPFQPGLDPQRG